MMLSKKFQKEPRVYFLGVLKIYSFPAQDENDWLKKFAIKWKVPNFGILFYIIMFFEKFQKEDQVFFSRVLGIFYPFLGKYRIDWLKKVSVEQKLYISYFFNRMMLSKKFQKGSMVYFPRCLEKFSLFQPNTKMTG